MTAEELKQAGQKLYGEKGWIAALAADLHLENTQVWRYVTGRSKIPGPVAILVQTWLEKKDGHDPRAEEVAGQP